MAGPEHPGLPEREAPGRGRLAHADGGLETIGVMSVSFRAPSLMSDLVSLGQWRFGDTAALAPACGDEGICRFTTVPQLYTPASAQAWVELQHQRLADGTAVVLAIRPSGDRRPVGMVGLRSRSVRRQRQARLLGD